MSLPHLSSSLSSDGAVAEPPADLLTELVVHREDVPEAGELQGTHHLDSDGDYRIRREHTQHLPWWKRPSPWWVLGIMPFAAIAMSAAMAPRIEIYTLLACSVHKPDIFKEMCHRHSAPTPAQWSRFEPIVSRSDKPLVHATESIGFPFNEGKVLEWVWVGEDTGEKPGNPCASDPVVQAEVAKLSLVISTSMGIISCLTTGWWGSFSDRRGRTRMLGISVFGLLVADFTFILVSLNFYHLPGGYWLLVIGPVVEGLLGGFTASATASQAYIADTTTESSRAHMFSLCLGLMFTGVALGPSLGALLIRFTGYALSVFYATFTVHLLYALFVWFVIPESLLEHQMRHSRFKYEKELRDLEVERAANPLAGFLVKTKRLFAFLTPLTIFFPDNGDQNGAENPMRQRKRDWSLTLIAAGYGLSTTVLGSYAYKFQYAASAFGWTSETLGYWISLVGAARAAFLTLVLPLIIKCFKPRPREIEILPSANIPATTPDVDLSTGEQQPLLSRSSVENPTLSSRPSGRKAFKKDIHNTTFDMALARGSLLVDLLNYTFMALVPTPWAFTICSLMGSFSAGFGPTVQSVALAMYKRKGGTESGKLFGALSVVQALCSQIAGPALYGLVYMNTVAVFPRTIFFVTVVTVLMSFLLVAFVRVPDGGAPVGTVEDGEQEIRIHGGRTR